MPTAWATIPSGAVAVLLQANPNLTPPQIQQALQATAIPVSTSADDVNAAAAAPFWQVGYGHVDLVGAVNLVKAKNWAQKLSQAQSQADSRVLASIGYTIPRSDVWSYDAPRLAAGGSDHRMYAAPVASTVTHLKVTLSHPSGAVLGENGMIYTVTVRDASGQVLGTTTEAATGAGTASPAVTFRNSGVSTACSRCCWPAAPGSRQPSAAREGCPRQPQPRQAAISNARTVAGLSSSMAPEDECLRTGGRHCMKRKTRTASEVARC